MALLATQSITRAGVSESLVAAAGGGDTFAPGKHTFLHLINAGGGAITVTFVTPGERLPNVGIADGGGSVPAGFTHWFGPFPPEYFADTTTGLVHVTYSGVASVLVAALNLSQP